MCNPRLPALLALVLAAAACGSPPQRNPLHNQELLPPCWFRGAVKSERTVNLLPALDDRGLAAPPQSEAERNLAIAAVDLLQSYVAREVRQSGTFAAVRVEPVTRTDLELQVGLLAFTGRVEGPLSAPVGVGEIAFRARVVRVADGKTLLERRYQHRIEEKRMAMVQPDPLALACAALKAATEELLIDLDRLDFDARAGE